MMDYRIYLLETSGSFRGVHLATCLNDVKALVTAATTPTRMLWCGNLGKETLGRDNPITSSSGRSSNGRVGGCYNITCRNSAAGEDGASPRHGRLGQDG
jgi:hypothetical protein